MAATWSGLGVQRTRHPSRSDLCLYMNSGHRRSGSTEDLRQGHGPGHNERATLDFCLTI